MFTTQSLFLTLVPYLISLCVSLGIGLAVLRRTHVPGAVAFGWLALFETIWTTGYIIQSINPTLAGQLLWNNIQFIGAVGTPVAFFWFCLTYAGVNLASTRQVQRPVNLLSTLVLLFIWTDGLHHLFRINPALVQEGLFYRLVFIDGPLFSIYPLFGYSLLAVGSYFLVRNVFTSPRIYRFQVITVLIGILIPWVTTVLTWLRWVPVLLHDIVPLTFGFSNLIVGYALARYGLFDLVPIAYQSLVEQMDDGILVLQPGGRIQEINPAAQRILGKSFESAVGKSIDSYLPDRFARWSAGINEELALRVGDTDCIFEVRATPLRDNRLQVSGVLVLLRDITGQKASQQALYTMAITDPLTGAFNRRHFFALGEKEVERSIRCGLPVSVVIFDMDNFKLINDTFGHLVGDQVLCALSAYCRDTIRPYDIFARFGGEEFILLLPETRGEQAFQVAERMRARIANHLVDLPQGPVSTSASFGVAELNLLDTPTLDKLVDRADQALYRAKRSGRNRVVWQE